MNTKFTKGEWNLAEGKTYCAIRTEESIIADIRTVNGTYNKYDAHLIAAAPDMYELLLKFLPMDEDGNGPFEYNEGSEHYGEEVKALIAKARGEL